jgi:Na+:H+ antiporter, NhaA family
VILGLMAPTRPHIQPELVDESALTDLSSVSAARETATLARHSVSVVEWLEHVLHPWTSFVIVPLFALANAGVTISTDALSDAVTSPVTLGALLGLVVGKLAGITAFTWLSARLGIGVLPEGATWRGIAGVAAVAGIGFTVSLFITGLAFDDPGLQDEAKIGILAAAIVAGGLGAVVLAGPGRAPSRLRDHARPEP